MSKTLHRIYVWSMVLITVVVTVYLAYTGVDYYRTPLEERYFHPYNQWFKASGSIGHGLGIIGTLMILFGVGIYIARKRYNFLSRYIRLKYLLEFHIFLCTLGPILVLFHTTFKFGGIVSVAFWSMVVVVLSGVVGRFIYIQIPRTIQGRELGLNEVKAMKQELSGRIAKQLAQKEDDLLEEIMNLVNRPAPKGGLISGFFAERQLLSEVRRLLRRGSNLSKDEIKGLLKLISNERSLEQKIGRLEKMKQLFKYWHVAHLPFALIMLVIVLIHVIVTLSLGYKWIF